MFSFLGRAALHFEFPSRRIVAHEHERVSVRVFKPGLYSSPGGCLRRLPETDPSLGPRLQIRKDPPVKGVEVGLAICAIMIYSSFLSSFQPTTMTWFSSRAFLKRRLVTASKSR